MSDDETQPQEPGTALVPVDPENFPTAAQNASQTYAVTPGTHDLMSPPHPMTMEPESAKGVLRNLWSMFSSFAAAYDHPVDGVLGAAVAHTKFLLRSPTP